MVLFDVSMRRRRFIELLGMAAASGSVAAGATNATGNDPTVETLAFPPTGNFHAPGWDPLTDEAVVPVWAEGSATNDDADYANDAFEYWTLDRSHSSRLRARWSGSDRRSFTTVHRTDMTTKGSS
jgi:hypothetical protein